MRRWLWLSVFALFLVLPSARSNALTAAEIITRARLLLRDSSSDTTRQRFSDAQLLNLLNDAQREMNSLAMVQKASFTFTLTGGTTEYPLPTDFLTAWRVLHKDRKMEQTSFDAEDAQSEAWMTASGTPQRYYIYAATTPVIGFIPAPTTVSTGTAVVYYIQQTTDMTADTETPFSGWVQAIPYHSALAYFVTYRGLWLLGDIQLADRYAQEWALWIESARTGLINKPDYNPSFTGGRRP